MLSLFNFFWSVGKHDANCKRWYDWIGEISGISVNLWLKVVFILTFGELKWPVLLSSHNTCRIATDNNAIEE